MDKMHLKALSVDDLRDVARIHIDAFPDSALSAFGMETVRRYYEWQLTGPHECVALGVFGEEVVLGYCFGGRFNGAMTGYLYKNRVFFLTRLLMHPNLIRSPLIRDRMMDSLRLLQRRKVTPEATGINKSTTKSFGILAIAVDPECQGCGVGQLLMTEMESVASKRGYSQMDLTVRPTNHKAVMFYEHIGWKRIDLHRGWQGKMIKPVKSDFTSVTNQPVRLVK